MSHDPDLEVKQLTRALSEIAHSLESIDEPAGRVHRVLVLTGGLVRYEQCALLTALPDRELEVVVHPAIAPVDRVDLHARMQAMLRLITDDDGAYVADESRHLSLPVMGLDQVIGVLRVTPPTTAPYEARHVRLLSVVAAQIGAYLALVKLHAAQERQTRDLAVVNEVQRTLAGIVSHDLRAPLHVITMVAATLLPGATDQRQVRALERALRNAEKATRLIDDLLDVTQARVSGAIAVRPVEADLHALLLEIVDDARTAHPTRTIVLDDDVAGPLIGAWDRDRVSQLATNLLENALHHGDRARPVTIALHADAASALFSVHNHGPAIAAAALRTIFDPFKRGALERSRGGGIGLGLYIVDQIAQAHGGAVSVSSDPNRGTTFAVTLPIVQAVAPVAEAVAVTTVIDDTIVMVVDDDDDARAGTAAILERRGYVAAVAANGAEALALLRGGLRPQLMLVDIYMPVLDGHAFAEACRADPQLAAIPILFVSADTAAAARAAQAGAAGVLTKPVRAETLMDRIASLSPRTPLLA